MNPIRPIYSSAPPNELLIKFLRLTAQSVNMTPYQTAKMYAHIHNIFELRKTLSSGFATNHLTEPFSYFVNSIAFPTPKLALLISRIFSEDKIRKKRSYIQRRIVTNSKGFGFEHKKLPSFILSTTDADLASWTKGVLLNKDANLNIAICENHDISALIPSTPGAIQTIFVCKEKLPIPEAFSLYMPLFSQVVIDRSNRKLEVFSGEDSIFKCQGNADNYIDLVREMILIGVVHHSLEIIRLAIQTIKPDPGYNGLHSMTMTQLFENLRKRYREFLIGPEQFYFNIFEIIGRKFVASNWYGVQKTLFDSAFSNSLRYLMDSGIQINFDATKKQTSYSFRNDPCSIDLMEADNTIKKVLDFTVLPQNLIITKNDILVGIQKLKQLDQR
jgi:hypothetical protein